MVYYFALVNQFEINILNFHVNYFVSVYLQL